MIGKIRAYNTAKFSSVNFGAAYASKWYAIKILYKEI